MNMIFYIFIFIFILYFIIALYFYLKQNKLLYRPYKKIELTPSFFEIDFEEVFFYTSDNIKLNAWYIPSRTKTCKTLLFCHGNSGNISHRLESIKIFHNLGLNVFIFDYRGYGKSEGYPTENGTYKDGEAAWHYLIKKKNCTPENIIIFGRSLGGAIAVELATKFNPGKVIVESSFTSITDMAKKLIPLFSISFLIKNKYLSYKKINNIKCSALIIHSKDDSLVPFEHGIKLFKKIKSQKQFLEIIGSHNEGFLLSGDKYIDGLQNFIS